MSEHFLKSFSLQRQQGREKVLKHSQFVVHMKFLITAVAALAIFILILWPLVSGDDMRVNLSFTEVEQLKTAEKPALINPRFHGIDEDRQPFNVTATRATQQSKESYVLEEVSGDIQLKNNIWFYLSAMTGDLDMSDKSLLLNGSVNLVSDTGFEVFTESAVINLHESSANGDSKVSMQGPFGTLDAQGFIIRDMGKTFLFFGGVKTRIYPSEKM